MATFHGACDGDPADATDRISQAVLTPGGMVLDPSGFPGRICVDGVACVMGSPLSVSIAPGTYAVSVPSSLGASPSNMSSVVGALTVQPDGRLSLDSALATSFSASPTDSRLVARTAPVIFDFSGYKGTLAIWEVQSVRGPTRTISLVRGRRYSMQAYYTMGLKDVTTGVNDTSDWMSPVAGLIVDASEDRVILGPGMERYFASPVGLTLKARTADVTLDYNGYEGYLKWWEVDGARGPTLTTSLLCGRRYSMQAHYSTGLDDQHDWLSPSGNGVEVSPACDRVTPDAGGADRYFSQTTTEPLKLTAKTTAVEVVFNGYPGTLTIWEVASNRGPRLTTKLLKGRRYGMQAYYSVALTDQSDWLSGSGLKVSAHGDPAGDMVTADRGLEKHFTFAGTTLSARVAPVAVDFAGYRGRLSWWEHGNIVDSLPPTPMPLLVNRRYALQSPYATTPGTASWSTSPAFWGVSVIENQSGQQSLGLDTETAKSFTASGTTLKARLSRVVITPPAGYTSNVCVADVICAPATGTFTTYLLANREFRLQNGGTFSVVSSDGSCSAQSVPLGQGQATLQCTSNPSACDGTVGAACDDGDPCTTYDTCNGVGVCLGGPPVLCAAGPSCSPNLCNRATGQCEATIAPAGTQCSTANACLLGEVCDGSGHCGGGVPVSCDDGNECTQDSCSSELGCLAEPICSGGSSSLYPVSVRVVDEIGIPRAGVAVLALDGASQMGPSKVTGADGLVSFGLPLGDYRFSATVEGSERVSGTEDHCSMGSCSQALIRFRAPPGPRCESDQACTGAAGTGRRLHIVTADAAGGGLFHGIRASDSGQFVAPFSNVLGQMGPLPWYELGRTTKIVDVAAHARGNELVVLVLIQSSRACDPAQFDCTGPPKEFPAGPPPTYSLWQTVRHPDSWRQFTRVPFGTDISFRSISLSGIGRDFMTFCGAAADGQIWTAESRPFLEWSTLANVNEMAGQNPGVVTRVSCQSGFYGRPLAVTALAGGRLWATYVDPDNGRSYPDDAARTPGWDLPGFDDLTARLSLPSGLEDLDVVGLDRVGDFHAVVRTAGGPRQHALRTSTLNSSWSPATPIDSVFGAAVVRGATALASGAGHLQVVQTDGGRLLMARRLSVSGTWGPLWSVGPEAIEGRDFGLVAAAEEVPIPNGVYSEPIVEEKRDELTFAWFDGDDFESGYRIYDPLKLIATAPAVPGIPDQPDATVFRLPKSQLEFGRLYWFNVAAFSDAGESIWKGVRSTTGPIVTVARPAAPTGEYVETNGGGCFACDYHFNFFFSFEDNSQGRPNLDGTRTIQLMGIHDDGRAYNSVVFPLRQPPLYRMSRSEFESKLGPDLSKWRLFFQVEGKDTRWVNGPSTRFSNPRTWGAGNSPPPSPPPAVAPKDLVNPPCCFPRIRQFGEE